MKRDFVCEYCGRKVVENKKLSIARRNHCPFCLWSKHIDLVDEGDRKADCRGLMEPVGLTFKKVKPDKYGKKKIGELMVVHRCSLCGKVSINRIAADDSPEKILEIFEKSKEIDEKQRKCLEDSGIEILDDSDFAELQTQLFGLSKDQP